MYHSPVAAELLLVYTIAFSDDGSWFVLGGQDGRILLWPTNKAIDVQWKPAPTEMESQHENFIYCLALSCYFNKLNFSGAYDKSWFTTSTHK